MASFSGPHLSTAQAKAARINDEIYAVFSLFPHGVSHSIFSAFPESSPVLPAKASAIAENVVHKGNGL